MILDTVKSGDFLDYLKKLVDFSSMIGTAAGEVVEENSEIQRLVTSKLDRRAEARNRLLGLAPAVKAVKNVVAVKKKVDDCWLVFDQTGSKKLGGPYGTEKEANACVVKFVKASDGGDSNFDDEFDMSGVDFDPDTEFLNQKMQFGSPGYPMVFIPRQIKDLRDGRFEFTGDIPSMGDGGTDQFFVIPEKNLTEVYVTGETFWIGKDGAHMYLGVPIGSIRSSVGKKSVLSKKKEFGKVVASEAYNLSRKVTEFVSWGYAYGGQRVRSYAQSVNTGMNALAREVGSSLYTLKSSAEIGKTMDFGRRTTTEVRKELEVLASRNLDPKKAGLIKGMISDINAVEHFIKNR